MATIAEPILVAVTGLGRNTEALRFAIREARALGCGLTLVHAVDPVMPAAPSGTSITDEDWAVIGAHIVADVRRELALLLAEDPLSVTTMVHLGSPSALFCQLSERASRIVLQYPDASRRHRIVTGSTIATIAAGARCPVVSVPGSGKALGDRGPGRRDAASVSPRGRSW